MGSGKSFIGKQLAESMNKQFIDTDAMIGLKEGRNISEIFSKEGETYFRQCEKELIDTLQGEATNTIISTGGGMPVYQDNLKELGTVIYLKVPFETILARLSKDELARRPLFKDMDKARENYVERNKIYEERSDIIVDGGQAAEMIINNICEKL